MEVSRTNMTYCERKHWSLCNIMTSIYFVTGNCFTKVFHPVDKGKILEAIRFIWPISCYVWLTVFHFWWAYPVLAVACNSICSPTEPTSVLVCLLVCHLLLSFHPLLLEHSPPSFCYLYFMQPSVITSWLHLSRAVSVLHMTQQTLHYLDTGLLIVLSWSLGNILYAVLWTPVKKILPRNKLRSFLPFLIFAWDIYCI